MTRSEVFRYELARKLRKVYEQTGERMVRWARVRSSGRKSLAELRRMDHPYAIRHGSPKLKADYVNMQSGEYRDSWEATVTFDPVTLEGGSTLQNVAPHAEFLHGKHRPRSKMFRRPVPEWVAARVKPGQDKSVVAGIKAAYRKALRG